MRSRFGSVSAAVLLGIAPLASGCLEIGRMTFRFDLAAGRGTLVLEDIGTDDADDARDDFATLVNEYVLGERVQEEHPGWRVGERRLFENEERLDGVVTFGFDRPADAMLYQHDKKSAWLWCADRSDEVIATSGTIVPMYPACVMFDRKAKTLEVTVTTTGDADEHARTSLLPQFQAWDNQPVPASGGTGGASGLGPLGDALGDALRQAAGLTGLDPASGLGGLLPQVDVDADWKALGLPIAGSQIVYQTDRTFQANHQGTSPAGALAAYDRALVSVGFVSVEKGDDLWTWSKGDDKLTATATQAGASVIVSLSR